MEYKQCWYHIATGVGTFILGIIGIGNSLVFECVALFIAAFAALAKGVNGLKQCAAYKAAAKMIHGEDDEYAGRYGAGYNYAAAGGKASQMAQTLKQSGLGRAVDAAKLKIGNLEAMRDKRKSVVLFLCVGILIFGLGILGLTEYIQMANDYGGKYVVDIILDALDKIGSAARRDIHIDGFKFFLIWNRVWLIFLGAFIAALGLIWKKDMSVSILAKRCKDKFNSLLENGEIKEIDGCFFLVLGIIMCMQGLCGFHNRYILTQMLSQIIGDQNVVSQLATSLSEFALLFSRLSGSKYPVMFMFCIRYYAPIHIVGGLLLILGIRILRHTGLISAWLHTKGAAIGLIVGGALFALLGWAGAALLKDMLGSLGIGFLDLWDINLFDFSSYSVFFGSSYSYGEIGPEIIFILLMKYFLLLMAGAALMIANGIACIKRLRANAI